MKRIITFAVLLCALCVSASSAFAFPGPTVHHVGGWWWQAPRTIGHFIIGEVPRGWLDTYEWTPMPNGCEQKVKKHFILWLNYRDNSRTFKLDSTTPTGETRCGTNVVKNVRGGE